MQFLMNKTRKELRDLFTNYKCIAFCINLSLQSCFGNLARVKGKPLALHRSSLFPCFDVFPVDKEQESR